MTSFESLIPFCLSLTKFRRTLLLPTNECFYSAAFALPGPQQFSFIVQDKMVSRFGIAMRHVRALPIPLPKNNMEEGKAGGWRGSYLANPYCVKLCLIGCHHQEEQGAR